MFSEVDQQKYQNENECFLNIINIKKYNNKFPSEALNKQGNHIIKNNNNNKRPAFLKANYKKFI